MQRWMATGIAVAACAALAGWPSRAGAERATVDRFDTVVIDAGHGGEDEGARGPRGLLEKAVVLDVAHRLASRLGGNGLRIVMTRREDVFVPLEERFSIANDARGDLFVSIHANAARDADIRGSETYFLSLDASDDSAQRVADRENRAFGPAAAQRRVTRDPLVAILGDLMSTEHLHESSAFAHMAQTRLSRIDPATSRGVKQAPFVVLTGVQMPASLIEIGFITNRDDERMLRSGRGRDSIVAALAQAVLEYGRRHDALLGIGAAIEHGAP